ncbi:DUF2937 family protein [Pelagibius sp. Alg239-R121]|uniref:DUF2937 family protein n=1 Tax=Pelagibius sp. Alg239-R121 TaxID=2993448 RepID=UPI0024A6FD1D|nr:DUF2937 family protein [Pelagibius sp. Alg239-R121]
MPLIARIVYLTAAAAGGSTTSQFPEFFQQYLQRLGGHLDQAALQADRIKEAAIAEKLPLKEYLDSFLTSQIPAHRRQGEILLQELADVDRLRISLESLTQSPVWQRPFIMASQAEADILEAAATAYKPAVPITPEGLAYAAAGAFLAIFLLKSLKSIPSLFRRKAPQ